jgi:hypothetical protein
VVHYSHDGGPFTRYVGRERVVGPEEVIDAARQLLAGSEPDPSATAGTDVLVCTHGRRDRCCGSMGTELALELLANPDRFGPQTRVRRTSHTGGHRFAPTALVFPDGTGWAFADLDLLARVAARQGPITDVVGHYRGCGGLTTPKMQVLERAVLGEMGWDLFGLPRWGSEEPDGTVRLYVKAPKGTVTWEATVSAGRVLPVPECGALMARASKTNTEFALRDLRRIS